MATKSKARAHTGTILFLLCAACGSSQSETIPSQSRTATLNDFLSETDRGSNYLCCSTLEEMLDTSDAVATGKIVSARPGRTIVYHQEYGDRIRTPTVVAEFWVTQVMLGGGESLYVEFLLATGRSAFAADIEAPESMVFLREASSEFNSDAYEAVDAGKGYPQGETLYTPTTYQALVIEGDEGLTQPLAPSSSLFTDSGATLEELTEVVQQLLGS